MNNKIRIKQVDGQYKVFCPDKLDFWTMAPTLYEAIGQFILFYHQRFGIEFDLPEEFKKPEYPAVKLPLEFR